ncbi:CMP-N-acetylneuraminic acid synthetase [Campylobacter mucosalis]|uniref:Pseudaminic acid cytidylyltransferase n=1 Tax=Campylobacter mucosalis CCUG 21559 TaxID=1032067 RepID=A0A6G5QEV3_9BACT|nr:pseudaminic acid cytidylyltransferase [Campylobacter mucosalis]KEA45850.1 CMP-N-acetylneuraminic acid synthetase [Campylobacter mucosalis]QCD44026.1 CMP-pseudaminic acid synthetase [Campylobacter mucosalis CCUG 21559]QKF62382.1 CMP-pseudaminic acid synthetase [Campylobacter mucosalis]
MRLCVIPARGGSKRIPHKNIKDFCGMPLIAYSIKNALNSAIFDDVIVSTDDEKIAEVAVKYGAKVPFLREAKLSDDFATSSDVVRDAIVKMGDEFSEICCLYATAPLLTPDILVQAYAQFKAVSCEFLFSATEFSFAIQRAFKLDENSYVKMFHPEFENVRSQDLERAYHDAGQFYFGKRKAWLDNKAMFAPYSRAFVLPRNLVCDIDTPDDFEFAKKLFMINHQS